MYEGIANVLLATAGIVCLILLTYFAGRWYMRTVGTAVDGRHIHIVERVVLGRMNSLLIVDIAGRQYLIGAGEQRIDLLKELEEPIPVERPGGRESSFKAYITSYLNKRNES